MSNTGRIGWWENLTLKEATQRKRKPKHVRTRTLLCRGWLSIQGVVGYQFFSQLYIFTIPTDLSLDFFPFMQIFPSGTTINYNKAKKKHLVNVRPSFSHWCKIPFDHQCWILKLVPRLRPSGNRRPAIYFTSQDGVWIRREASNDSNAAATVPLVSWGCEFEVI